MRKETAIYFITLHPELARNAFPNTSEAGLQKSVERSIESIFKRAVTDNKSMNLEARWDRTAIQAANAALIAEEPRPEMKAYLAALEQHIEREMYP